MHINIFHYTNIFNILSARMNLLSHKNLKLYNVNYQDVYTTNTNIHIRINIFQATKLFNTIRFCFVTHT